MPGKSLFHAILCSALILSWFFTAVALASGDRRKGQMHTRKLNKARGPTCSTGLTGWHARKQQQLMVTELDKRPSNALTGDVASEMMDMKAGVDATEEVGGEAFDSQEIEPIVDGLGVDIRVEAATDGYVPVEVTRRPPNSAAAYKVKTLVNGVPVEQGEAGFVIAKIVTDDGLHFRNMIFHIEDD